MDLASAEEATRFLAAATAQGATLVRFEPHRDDLETIFMKALSDDASGTEARA